MQITKQQIAAALRICAFISMENYIQKHLKVIDYTRRETNYLQLVDNWYNAKIILGYE